MINIYIYVFNFGSIYFYTRPLKKEMHKQIESVCSCRKSTHKVYIPD